jgi:hypothetical protein
MNQESHYDKNDTRKYPPFEFLQRNPELHRGPIKFKETTAIPKHSLEKDRYPQIQAENLPKDYRKVIEEEVREQIHQGMFKNISIEIANTLAGLTKDQIIEAIEKKMKDLPFNINLNLNIHQQQNPEQIAVGHVNHGAIAIKDSNAVDHPVNSSVAQAHSNAADNPDNSSVAQDKSAASDNPDNSAVALKDSNASDNSINSTIGQEKSAASGNTAGSAVSLKDSNASDNPLLSNVDQEKDDKKI